MLKDFLGYCIFTIFLYDMFMNTQHYFSIIGLVVLFFTYHLRLKKINKTLKQELLTSNKKIESINNLKINEHCKLAKQKEHFIEVLLHDLKTPTLAQLRGLELLTSQIFGEMSQEQAYMISEIKKSCQYTLDMIGMVLNVYRLEEGEIELKYERFNLIELTKECFSNAIDINSDNNMDYELETNFDGNIRADKHEIKKVMLRLLESAIIYSDKETPIKIQLKKNNHQIKVSLTTTGISLSEKDCNNIFDKYSDGKLQFSTIGQGIGLFMSKKIINLHNGEIYAESDGKSINTFSFIIPAYTQQTTAGEGFTSHSPQLSY